MMDDEDDIYPESEPQMSHNSRAEVKMEDIDYDEEEGEEVEDDDSDVRLIQLTTLIMYTKAVVQDEINFITDAKEESKPETTSQSTTQGSCVQHLYHFSMPHVPTDQ